MISKFFLILFIFSIGLFYCQSNQIELSNSNIRMRYDCDNFRPQVESYEEIRLLNSYALQVARELREEKKMVTLNSLIKARKEKDYRKVEEIVVNHLCNKKHK